jgi:hypothetical protein
VAQRERREAQQQPGAERRGHGDRHELDVDEQGGELRVLREAVRPQRRGGHRGHVDHEHRQVGRSAAEGRQRRGAGVAGAPGQRDDRGEEPDEERRGERDQSAVDLRARPVLGEPGGHLGLRRVESGPVADHEHGGDEEDDADSAARCSIATHVESKLV